MKTEVSYAEVYSERGPRFWNRHPMSISSLMARGVSIPVWRPAQFEIEDAALTEEENEQIAFLRMIMGTQ